MPKNVKVEAVEPEPEEPQFYMAMPVYHLLPSQVAEMERSAEENRGKGDPVSLPPPDHYVFQPYGGVFGDGDEGQDVIDHGSNP